MWYNQGTFKTISPRQQKKECMRKCKQTKDSQQCDQNRKFGTCYRNKSQKLFQPYVWLLVNKINRLVGGELREYNVNQSRRCYCFARQWLGFMWSSISSICHPFLDKI